MYDSAGRDSETWGGRGSAGTATSLNSPLGKSSSSVPVGDVLLFWPQCGGLLPRRIWAACSGLPAVSEGNCSSLTASSLCARRGVRTCAAVRSSASSGRSTWCMACYWAVCEGAKSRSLHAVKRRQATQDISSERGPTTQQKEQVSNTRHRNDEHMSQ